MKTQVSHTPGPWTDVSDARLIAAAPDMLEALEMVLAVMCDKEICGHFLPQEIRDVVEPAIRKAKGE